MIDLITNKEGIVKAPAILIVDDDKTICDLICEGLSYEGYFCDAVSNAGDAISKLKWRSFDVALVDIILPGMSGIDLLRTLEKSHQTTAIVIVTAVIDINTAIESMKLGALDYIIKPFTLETINTTIMNILESKKRQNMVHDTVITNRGHDTDHLQRELNNIADGVNAHVEYFDFHSKIVIEKTVELARWLGLPEKEIEKWARAQYELYSERDRRIKSALKKLERSPFAQTMLGLTHSIHRPSKSEENQN